MNRRTPMLETDLSSWAEFDANSLAAKQRDQLMVAGFPSERNRLQAAQMLDSHAAV
ncbi:MAG: hypothetical protein JF606_00390 [Burkholderiales bacterium]|jgi:hypothetical protein|nr:hypothetical protein [Burkholderiales bacterium]